MRQPNIILIMTDQQRMDTIQAWGYDYMVTPNMDRLIAGGVSFRQTYCPGATCIASRAALFTGMYAHNTGVYSFMDWSEHDTWVHDLSRHGYYCANIGKMHFTPTHDRGGFHERVIVENPTTTEHWRGGPDDDWGNYLRIHGYERPNHRHLTDPAWIEKYQGVPWHLPEEMHSDVFIGNSAVTWIEGYRGEKPFFLQVGFTGPHEPWDPLPRHVALYRDEALPPAVTMPGDLENKPPQHRTHKEFHAHSGHESRIDLSNASAADIEHMRRHYYAKITTVDEQLGRVLDALESRGFLEDSLVIFCSDHGEMLGDHTLAYKWLMYDTIVHVTMILKSTSQKGQNLEVHELVSLMDIGPTILEAAGIEIPSYIEGQSLLPYLRDEETQPRPYVICEDNYQVMLRTRTHKLVYYIGQDDCEFYDLQADPHEFHNLWRSEAHTKVRGEYLHMLLDFLATSNYFTSGYKRARQKQYRVRWHGEGDTTLHGGTGFVSPS